MMPMPKMAIACPYSCGGKTSYRMACDVDSSAPPPSPWMIRQKISWLRVCELPQKNEASVKIAIEPAK